MSLLWYKIRMGMWGWLSGCVALLLCAADLSAAHGAPGICRDRLAFERDMCKHGRTSNTGRKNAAKARYAKHGGHFRFTPKERKHTRAIFKRVRTMLIQKVRTSALPTSTVARMTNALAATKLDDASFGITRRPWMSDEDWQSFQKRCSSGGRWTVDNAFYWGSRPLIILCPFHVAKAFALGYGKPEDILVMNIAHELGHAIDWWRFSRTYRNLADACYGKYHAFPAGSGSHAFNRTTDDLCCCPKQLFDRLKRKPVWMCTKMIQCGIGAARCDVEHYMREIVADQWSYEVMAEWASSRSVAAKRTFFGRNLYWYCGGPRKSLPQNSRGGGLTHPRGSFRLVEAYRNRSVRTALGCKTDRLTLYNAKASRACWDRSRKNLTFGGASVTIAKPLPEPQPPAPKWKSGTYLTGLKAVIGTKTSAPCRGWTWINADLNKGAGGKYIYFCYQAATSGTGITDVTFAVGGKNARCPSSDWTRDKLDLNKGSGGRFIYTCTRRGGSKTVIRGLKVTISRGRGNLCGGGWTQVNTDLNKGARGRWIYLCVQR